MDHKKYLLEQIKKCRRKMNMAKLMDSGVLFMAAGGIFGIVCEAVSLFWPFYYAHPAAVFCFAAGFLAGVCHAIYKRADMKQAAGKIDSFGLKERMLTAYETMEKEDAFSQLLRQDAYVCYERIQAQVKIPLLPGRRHMLALLVSVFTAVCLSLLPSPVREQAALLHQVREQAEEEKKELEEFLEILEGVDRERLSQEQKARLQELADMMELSREELVSADSWESLSAATQRLDYKYGQAGQSLAQLVEETAHTEAAGIADAEAFAKAAASQNGQQTASAGNGGQNGQQTASSGSGGRQNGQQATSSGNGSQNGKEGSGESGSQKKGNSQNGADGSGQGSGSQSGGGNGQESGSDSGEGGSQEERNGSSSGEGNAQSGNGSGSGNGTGGGRGEGHSDAVHDYVSVPGKLGDDASLTGNKTGNENSAYYRGKNGLAWEGDHVDYSSVIGEYTDSAYEGIANGKYPDGMEPVIRDYFEQLNK